MTQMQHCALLVERGDFRNDISRTQFANFFTVPTVSLVSQIDSSPWATLFPISIPITTREIGNGTRSWISPVCSPKQVRGVLNSISPSRLTFISLSLEKDTSTIRRNATLAETDSPAREPQEDGALHQGPFYLSVAFKKEI